jgi:hypothetical protein
VAFGTKKNALRKTPFLENITSTLPLNGKIVPESFRRVVNTNLAAIASFLAYAIHDEGSFNMVLALLLMNGSECGGDPIPRENELFPEGTGPLVVYSKPDDLKSYLFEEDRLDEGDGFITNVVRLMNRLQDCLDLETDCAKYKKVFQKRRLESLMARTLASDLVEIYVCLGCFPISSELWPTRHPRLVDLIRHHSQRKMPVPLVVEYLMLLIQNKRVKVAASHVYSTATNKHDSKIVTYKGQPWPIKSKLPPPVRQIRYLFKLVDATVVGAEGEMEELERWMELGEVVNVILFGMSDPWKTEERIHWSLQESLPALEKRQAASLWVQPKGKEKEDGSDENAPGKKAHKGTGAVKKVLAPDKKVRKRLKRLKEIEDAAAIDGDVRPPQPDPEKGYSSTSSSSSDSDSEDEAKQPAKEKEDKNTDESEVDRSSLAVHGKGEQEGGQEDPLNLLDEAFNQVLQLLNNMGQQETEEAAQTKMILERIRITSTAISILTTAQLKWMETEEALSVGAGGEDKERYDIGGILLQLQKVLFKLKKLHGGKPGVEFTTREKGGGGMGRNRSY